MRNCVVFGANGFIGNHLCTALVNKGYTVRAFDIAKDMKMLQHLCGSIDMVTGDFANIEDVRTALEGVDTVFHLVSTTIPATSNQNMIYDIETNLIPTVNLLKAAAENGVKKVIYPSSGGAVYGIPSMLPVPETHSCNPIVSYGIVKFAIERYMQVFARDYGLRTVILRVGNPYGHRHYGYQQGIISVFLKKIKAGEDLAVWGDGSIVRDYIYIDDVIDAFLRAAEYEGGHTIFNIGSGEGISIKRLIEITRNVVKKDIQVEYGVSRGFDIPSIYLDISLAGKEFGWKPVVSMEEGIERAWHDIQSNDNIET